MKLVRDGIPAKILREGEKVEWYYVKDPDEILIRAKLQEELVELDEAKTLQSKIVEAGDVRQVWVDLCKRSGAQEAVRDAIIAGQFPYKGSLGLALAPALSLLPEPDDHRLANASELGGFYTLFNSRVYWEGMSMAWVRSAQHAMYKALGGFEKGTFLVSTG